MAKMKHGLKATHRTWGGLFFAGALFWAGQANATDYIWTNAVNANWNITTAWTPSGSFPGQVAGTDSATFTQGVIRTVTVSASALLADGFFRNPTLTTALAINSGQTLTFTNSLWIADFVNSTGTVSRTLVGILAVTNATGAAQFVIGGQGNGTFTLGSAAAAGAGTYNLIANQMIVADSTGGRGTFLQSVAGSRMIVSNMTVGNAGVGTYTLSTTATNNVWGSLVLGGQAGGSGTVVMSGGFLAVTNNNPGVSPAELIVGQNGAGTFTLSGGSLLVDNLVVATNANSAGTFTWNTGGALTVNSLGAESNDGMAIFTNFLSATSGTPAQWGSNSVQVLNFNTNVVGVANFYNGLVLGARGTGVVNFGQSGVASTANLFVTNAAGNAQLIVGQNGAGTFALNAGSLTVNQLLATNVTGGVAGSGFYTNSLVSFAAGTTLTTSNAASAVAAHIVITSNTSFTINGIWNLNGGTNLLRTTSTDLSNVGTVFVGNAVSSGAVTVGRGAVWALGTNGGAFLNLTVGTGTGGNGNSLIITNGGKVFAGNGIIGTASRTNNQVWVTGSGSVWSNTGFISLGAGANAFGNQLTIGNSGQVFSATGYVGGPPAIASSVRSNTVTITDTGSVWMISGDLLVGHTPANVSGIPFSGENHVIVSNGALLVSANTYVGGHSGTGVRGTTNNTVTVTGAGSVWSNNAVLAIGSGVNTAQINASNAVIVGAGGFVFNNGAVELGRQNARENSLTVTGTGSVFQATGGILVGNGNGASGNYLVIADGGVLISGASTLGNNQNTSNTYARIEGPGSRWDLGSAALNIGGNPTSFNALLAVSNGATLISGDLAVGGGSSASSNRYDAGGLGQLSYSTNLAITVGAVAGRHANAITITNAIVQATSLTVGAASSSNNTALILAGGLLEANTLATGNNGAGNTITNRGGVFQFSSTTILVTTNGGIGSIAIDNGTISFRDVTVNLTNNWRGSGLTNMAWVGNNTLRLNNATATNTLAGGYSFNPNVGPTNYARLEMINGTTAVTGNGITVETGGTMLVSNTTATVAGVFTNAGSLSFVNARATFQSRVYNSGTSTMLNTFATFAGGVVNAGHWATDPTTNVFASFGLTNTVSGGITMAAGDVYVFTNTVTATPADFINISTNHLATDLTAGKFLFSGGLGLTQTLTVAGHDLGPAAATATNLAIASSSAPGYVNNFALGTLEVSNFSTVRVTDAFLELGTNDFLMAGLYLENLFLGENSLLIIATNVQVYFKNSNNWSLVNIRLENNQSSLFGGDDYDYNNAISGLHQLVVVPEPSVLLLLLGGCATLWTVRRRNSLPSR